MRLVTNGESMALDKLLAMQTFVQVVDAGTFTRAADVMRMPKSTVTRMVQALEKEVGAKLLHRTTRQLSVTQEGAIYYEGALRLINELGQLEHRVAGATAVPIGRIKVEAPGAIVYSVLLPGLPAFFERYPQVQVELGVGNRTIDLIADHVDCVIRLGPIMNEMLVARPLGSIPMITCASAGYLARCGVPNDLNDVANHHTLIQIVAPSSGRIFTNTLEHDGVEATIEGSYQIAVNDSTAALVAGVAGLGIVTTYEFLVRPYLESGVLQRVLPEWQGEIVQAHVAYPLNRHLPSKLRVFVEWVGELFQQPA